MAKSSETVHLDEVGSTQDEARARCLDGGGHPVVVSADRQTSGRGRGGHGWINAPRAIAVSVAFSPTWAPAVWPRLALVGGLAARDAVGRIGLKWPNDLWVGDTIGGSKVGGILSEAAGSIVVIGMGLNLWWPDPPAGMGAIEQADPGGAAGRALAVAWAGALLERAERPPDVWGRDEYRGSCVTLGYVVEWKDRATDATAVGDAVDIGPAGELVVDVGGRRVLLGSAGVRAVRATTLAPGAGREPR